MRVEIYNAAVGNAYRIDSDNPETVAKWLGDLLPIMEYVGARSSNPPWYLTVYPSGEYDHRSFSEPVKLTAEKVRRMMVMIREM